MLTITAKINIDPNKIVNGIFDRATYTFAANTAYKLMGPYTPESTGTLKNSANVKIYGTDKGGFINYLSPYAHYIYEGKLYVAPNGSAWAKLHEKKHATNVNLRFSKEKAPSPHAHWDEAMLRDKKSDFLTAIQDYINKRKRGGTT